MVIDIERVFSCKGLNYRKDLVERKYIDEFYAIYELKKDKKWTDKKIGEGDTNE